MSNLRQYKERMNTTGQDQVVVEYDDTEVWLSIKAAKDTICVILEEAEIDRLILMLSRVKSIR